MLSEVDKICDNREIIIKDRYDVIVVGGGVAGISAAVASARGGAKTLLLEKQVNLGGLATCGLISWYEPLCDGEGNQMCFGIVEELIRLSIKYSFENLPKKWGGEGINPIRYDRFATYYSPTVFSLALDEYVRENGVDVRYDSLATYPKMNGGICEGILVESISGCEFFPASFIVDATGNAVIAARAGFPYEYGKNYLTYLCHDINKSIIERYNNNSDMCKLRNWSSCGSDMDGNGHPKDLDFFREDTAEAENEFLYHGKRLMLSKFKKGDKNSSDIMTLPTMPQYRKSRRIIGEYTFDGSEDGVEFEDCIGKCGDFRKPGKHFQIPYRCLYNSRFPNIITAGRIISSSGDGWEVTRVIPVCALTGQAAGSAAALCVTENTDFASLNVQKLRV